MKKLRWISLLTLLLLLLASTTAQAQNYRFSLDKLTADVIVNADGTISILYNFVFTNDSGASPIDFVDVGMPTSNFSMSGATAAVNGNPISVSRSDYQGSGSGLAAVLGARAIPPGKTATVTVWVPQVESWMRQDSKDPNYASLVFSPAWFGKQYLEGDTQVTVTFHLPQGVQPEEPRWHSAPSGFPSEPATGFDDQGRVTYTWTNANSTGYEQHLFGASFPAKYVPAAAIVHPSLWETLGIDPSDFYGLGCCLSGFIVFGGMMAWSSASTRKRKMQYLPPKIAIEGMGIKRGLTAVEAAVILEQPLDKVLTMILFGVVKKGAATVTSREPLEIQATNPLPEDLYGYETDFLTAFQAKDRTERRQGLQTMMVDLVKEVSTKMKGFSLKETQAYYKDIAERAWKQVEAANTPEVQGEALEKYMDWTMLDRDYDDRSRRVFTGPVFVPTWWPRYDPTYHVPAPHMPSSSGGIPAPGGGRSGGMSLPSLPGSAFAASMVRGVQSFSAGAIGNVSEFTSSVTNKTNPVPVVTSSRGSGGGGGGRSCACACACAGCACACAGGGR
jgi:hypothetical protein